MFENKDQSAGKIFVLLGYPASLLLNGAQVRSS